MNSNKKITKRFKAATVLVASLLIGSFVGSLAPAQAEAAPGAMAVQQLYLFYQAGYEGIYKVKMDAPRKLVRGEIKPLTQASLDSTVVDGDLPPFLAFTK